MDGFRVGEWLIQPSANRISRNGQSVCVRAKVMDLLVFFAQRPGEVVSKDALLDGVWGTSSLSTSSLTHSIAELRQAFDDDVERPGVIETIPKRGYRLIAPVQPVEESSVTPVPTVRAEEHEIAAADGSGHEAHDAGGSDRSEACGAPPPARFRAWTSSRGALILLGSISGAMLAAIGALAIRMWAPAPAPPVVRYALLPPARATFAALPSEPQPAVSPDGRQIAAVATAKDAARTLWLYTVESVAPRALAGTVDAASPFWSADGGWIGFFARGKLRKVRTSGGSPETICEASGGFGASWSARGTILFAPNHASGLYTVQSSGNTPVPATTLNASRQETSHRFPQFLPDGRHFIYLVLGSRREHSGLFLGSLDARGARRLGEADSNAVFVPSGHLLFVRGTSLMAQRFDPARLELTGEPVAIASGLLPAPALRLAPFSASSNVLTYRPGGMVASRLTWLNREGRTVGTVGDPAQYLRPSLSPDGKRIAVDILDAPTGNTDTWLVDLERGVSTRLTFGAALEGTPLWAPDGAHIVLASSRRGTLNLYERKIDEHPGTGTASDRLLIESPADKYPQAWSPDGQSLVYMSRSPDTRGDLWVLPMTDKRTPMPLVQTPFLETQAQISPDGRWLAYASDETGRLEVYVRPFQSPGARWRVSIDGGCQPRWRSDGKELFYLHRDVLFTVPIRAHSSPGIAAPLFNVAVGRTDDVTWEYVPAPDGQRFLVKEPVYDETENPLTVVLNWQALLSR